MKILEIRDLNDGSIDRYTVVYNCVDHYTPDGKPLYMAVGMNSEPFHPQGFGQHCVAMPGKHLGKKIKFSDLPKDCQRLVKQDLGGN